MKLVLTSMACPEQYDLIDHSERRIGYFRLRHGTFTADDADGRTVYHVDDLDSDGIFVGDERVEHMTAALNAVLTASGRDEPGLAERLLSDVISNHWTES